MVRLTTAFCILAVSSAVAFADNAQAGAKHNGGVQIAANMNSNPMDANARMRKKHKMMKSDSSMNKGMSGSGMNNGMSGGGMNNGMSGGGMNNGMSGGGMKNNGMSK